LPAILPWISQTGCATMPGSRLLAGIPFQFRAPLPRSSSSLHCFSKRKEEAVTDRHHDEASSWRKL
jgi:hypothetical protein